MDKQKISDGGPVSYQVEYMSRTDEIDHVVPYGDKFAAACAFAKRMSDKHDGTAYVVAIKELTDSFGTTKTVTEGHVAYTFGIKSDADGVFANAA